ncbi:major capsid protein [Nitrosomonas sp.]|uniref:major capsid protein n=1 Tax=Nitrosomonas sp. TaxID=42353 RepID=UPI00273041EF|nr:major capsid protein [Nitrosomonas sp.]MDP1788217.1 major capsid protein [Nitrosomonas sp.]
MNLRKKALLASLMLIPSVSFAAVPASVTAGVTEAVTDVGVIGAAVLGVIIVMAAFSWLRRMVK